MNYRHVYHAGNFADVIKHVVLLLCLDYLQKKEGPLCIIDAHGGAGLYDLRSEEAAKPGEWERGVGCLRGATAVPADLQLYLNAAGDDLKAGLYPGSPLLIARRLRPQDRMIATSFTSRHSRLSAPILHSLRTHV